MPPTPSQQSSLLPITAARSASSLHEDNVQPNDPSDHNDNTQLNDPSYLNNNDPPSDSDSFYTARLSWRYNTSEYGWRKNHEYPVTEINQSSHNSIPSTNIHHTTFNTHSDFIPEQFYPLDFIALTPLPPPAERPDPVRDTYRLSLEQNFTEWIKHPFYYEHTAFTSLPSPITPGKSSFNTSIQPLPPNPRGFKYFMTSRAKTKHPKIWFDRYSEDELKEFEESYHSSIKICYSDWFPVEILKKLREIDRIDVENEKIKKKTEAEELARINKQKKQREEENLSQSAAAAATGIKTQSLNNDDQNDDNNIPGKVGEIPFTHVGEVSNQNDRINNQNSNFATTSSIPSSSSPPTTIEIPPYSYINMTRINLDELANYYGYEKYENMPLHPKIPIKYRKTNIPSDISISWEHHCITPPEYEMDWTQDPEPEWFRYWHPHRGYEYLGPEDNRLSFDRCGRLLSIFGKWNDHTPINPWWGQFIIDSRRLDEKNMLFGTMEWCEKLYNDRVMTQLVRNDVDGYLDLTEKNHQQVPYGYSITDMNAMINIRQLFKDNAKYYDYKTNTLFLTQKNYQNINNILQKKIILTKKQQKILEITKDIDFNKLSKEELELISEDVIASIITPTVSGKSAGSIEPTKSINPTNLADSSTSSSPPPHDHTDSQSVYSYRHPLLDYLDADPVFQRHISPRVLTEGPIIWKEIPKLLSQTDDYKFVSYINKNAPRSSDQKQLVLPTGTQYQQEIIVNKLEPLFIPPAPFPIQYPIHTPTGLNPKQYLIDAARSGDRLWLPLMNFDDEIKKRKKTHEINSNTGSTTSSNTHNSVVDLVLEIEQRRKQDPSIKKVDEILKNPKNFQFSTLRSCLYKYNNVRLVETGLQWLGSTLHAATTMLLVHISDEEWGFSPPKIDKNSQNTKNIPGNAEIRDDVENFPNSEVNPIPTDKDKEIYPNQHQETYPNWIYISIIHDRSAKGPNYRPILLFTNAVTMELMSIQPFSWDIGKKCSIPYCSQGFGRTCGTCRIIYTHSIFAVETPLNYSIIIEDEDQKNKSKNDHNKKDQHDDTTPPPHSHHHHGDGGGDTEGDEHDEEEESQHRHDSGTHYTRLNFPRIFNNNNKKNQNTHHNSSYNPYNSQYKTSMGTSSVKQSLHTVLPTFYTLNSQFFAVLNQDDKDGWLLEIDIKSLWYNRFSCNAVPIESLNPFGGDKGSMGVEKEMKKTVLEPKLSGASISSTTTQSLIPTRQEYIPIRTVNDISIGINESRTQTNNNNKLSDGDDTAFSPNINTFTLLSRQYHRNINNPLLSSNHHSSSQPSWEREDLQKDHWIKIRTITPPPRQTSLEIDNSSLLVDSKTGLRSEIDNRHQQKSPISYRQKPYLLLFFVPLVWEFYSWDIHYNIIMYSFGGFFCIVIMVLLSYWFYKCQKNQWLGAKNQDFNKNQWFGGDENQDFNKNSKNLPGQYHKLNNNSKNDYYDDSDDWSDNEEICENIETIRLNDGLHYR